MDLAVLTLRQLSAGTSMEPNRRDTALHDSRPPLSCLDERLFQSSGSISHVHGDMMGLAQVAAMKRQCHGK